MKRNIKLMAVTFVSVLTLSSLLAAPHGRRGTDVLHLFLTKTMTNAGVETNAAGRVEIGQNRQGNADNQRLNISVNGLTGGATYELLALTGSNSVLTDVAQFTTDANGGASLQYRAKGN